MDRHIESFKLFGMFIALSVGSIFLTYISSSYIPESNYLPDDPLFLIFRSFLVLLVGFSFYFITKWR